MQNEEITHLLKKYLAGNCSEKERGLLETWYLKLEEKDLPLISQEKMDEQLQEIGAFLANRLELPVQEEPVVLKLKKWAGLWPKLAVAAMLIITLSIAFHFYNPGNQDQPILHGPDKISQSLESSNNKAMLTLADGRTISLDAAKNGEIAEQAGVRITKTKDGQLVYKGVAKENAFNTIATPRGGQYQINLPDGTKVWLNAASSLSYPAAFIGNKREVKLEGEAYFEVASHKKMPFIVQSKGQEVEVLGTHFNVNAYEDEPQIKTTLLEGRVKVKLNNSNAMALLEPGQQSISVFHRLDVATINVAEVVAWKEGYFLFQDEDIRSIMRKISRWYDVEVVYGANISVNKIGGKISRTKSLESVLKTLSKTDKFNFKLDGRRVTVMP
ncbi:FecR family protein [Pedobacter gandavensis]|uniref:FecR family protein n=1 Tax=Pedobacter gandavensis TaxID=2679963 RepID=UPI0029310D2A|nr:FecR family protein [Pedobacter gandavensis]